MGFQKSIIKSIPLKICLSILCVETVLLAIVGVYYTNRFSEEIDKSVLQKVLLPATMMSDRALIYDSVQDRQVISELLQEEVTKTFIVNTEKSIHYADNPSLEGKPYINELTSGEKEKFSTDLSITQTLNFTSENGVDSLSVLAPIKNNHRLLGAIYIRINAQQITQKKQAIANLFLVGAITTILLTTLLEFLWVYRIIVPRMRTMSAALTRIEKYDFSHRMENYGSKDELGILMQQVDQMAGTLQRYTLEIKEAEEQYREIFDASTDGIYRSSLLGNLLTANPALASMAGYDSVDEMLAEATNVGEQFYEDPKERHMILERLKKEKPIKDYELLMKRRDGTVVNVSMSAQATTDGDGQIKYIEGRIADITEKRAHEQAIRERQEAEIAAKAKTEMVASLENKNRELQAALTELKQTQKQLVDSEKMAVLGMTAGGVAHDLNNILSALISYPELLLMKLPKDSPMRSTVESILASGKRASAIVADMLTLSQGVALKRKPLSLNTLVEEYLESLEHAKLLKDYPAVQVRARLCSEALTVSCSPVHMQKIVMNLVINAVEATAKGGNVTVETTIDNDFVYPESQPASQESGDAGFAVLEITDDGVGIAPEDLNSIFEPFYTRKVMGKAGTGLGLTIVHNVVREHQGYVQPVSGGGVTKFTVWLPLVTQNVVQDPPEEEGDIKASGKVLVVDDEPVQRDLGKRVLSTLGYDVETVASGEEAVSYMSTGKVDVLLLDMIMAPGINGLETYRQILRTHPSQKAIIVSGFSMNRDVEEALSLGPAVFLQKPYTMSQIGKLLHDQLASS